MRAGLPDARVAVLTRNYGEAGAVDRYLPALRPATAGTTPTGTSGRRRTTPPPSSSSGTRRSSCGPWFGRVDLAARVDNGVGLDNDEQGVPVWIARDPRAPWPTLWPQLRRLG